MHAQLPSGLSQVLLSANLLQLNTSIGQQHTTKTQHFELKFIRLHSIASGLGFVQYTTKLVSGKEERSLKEARYLGLKQYQELVRNRKSVRSNQEDQASPVSSEKTVVGSNKKQEAISMKERVILFKDLYIRCKVRATGDLAKFFAHENHYCPPSLSEYGKLRHPSSKSDFLQASSLKYTLVQS